MAHAPVCSRLCVAMEQTQTCACTQSLSYTPVPDPVCPVSRECHIFVSYRQAFQFHPHIYKEAGEGNVFPWLQRISTGSPVTCQRPQQTLRDVL